MISKSNRLVVLVVMIITLITLIGCPQDVIRSYTITYLLDGGTNSNENPSNYNDESATIPLKNPSKTGHSFVGWFEDSVFTEPMLTEIPAGTKGNLTIYAKWTATTYTVTFDAQGGTASDPATKEVTFGATYGELATTEFTETGYTFGGWFTAKNGTENKITPATTVSTAADHPLYAYKEALSYAITYQLNGGANHDNNPASYTIETDTITFLAPTKAGYTFGGLYDNETFSGTAVTTITKGSNGNISLYAKWTVNDYTVTFDPQSGTASNPGTKQVTFNDAYGTLATTTRTGYTFDGWYTATESGGTEVTTTTVLSTASNHTLYAKWIANNYTVTFDAQSGTASDPATKEVTFNDAYGTLATTSCTGYNFDGWYTATGDGGTQVLTSTKLSVAGDHTLYAKWTPNNYTVTFNPQSGTTSDPTTKEVTFDDAYGTLATTTRTGYTFDGWYTATEGGGAEVTTTTVLSTASNHTLYAKWVPINYTITYQLNGGANEAGNPPTYTIESDTFTLGAPTRTGYTFSGWYDNETFSGTAVTTITQGSTGNTSFYVKWTPNNYTVTFNPQSGTASDPATKEVTFDATYGTLATTSRTGYTFSGWYTATEGGGTEVTTTTVLSTASNHTLYAKWVPINYTITYTLNGGTNASGNPPSYTIETDTITLVAPTKTGYTFNNWYDNITFTGDPISSILESSTGDKLLYASWTPNIYTVTFNPQSGTASDPAIKQVTFDAAYGDLATTNRAGYTFDGWYTAPSGGGTEVTTTTVLTTASNHTLYAKWIANNYTVTFNSQDGSASAPGTKDVIFDSPYGELATTSRTGYNFDGWYTATEGGGTQILATTTLSVASNHTLYAKWVPIIYTITYNLYGITNPSGNPPTYTIETETITLSAPTRTGYTFNNWYDNITFVGDPAPTIVKGSTGNISLYVSWIPNVYTITFDAQSGTASVPATKEVTFDNPYGELATTTRTGYTFSGWYTAAGGGGTRIFDTTILSVASNHTLYAKWVPIIYTITYTLNGGINASGNPPTFTIESSEITFDEPTRAGYYFGGWYTETSFENLIESISAATHENYTVYARWHKTYALQERGPAGGWIFYDRNLDSGFTNYNYRDGAAWRYLEAAKEDQPSEQWSRTWDWLDLSGGVNDIGKGKENTQIIVEKYGTESTAAYACDSYETTYNAILYDDWYLPTCDELIQLQKNLGTGDDSLWKIYPGGHWSSTEVAWDQAWIMLMDSTKDPEGKASIKHKSNTYKVRPIRQF